MSLVSFVSLVISLNLSLSLLFSLSPSLSLSLSLSFTLSPLAPFFLCYLTYPLKKAPVSAQARRAAALAAEVALALALALLYGGSLHLRGSTGTAPLSSRSQPSHREAGGGPGGG